MENVKIAHEDPKFICLSIANSHLLPIHQDTFMNKTPAQQVHHIKAVKTTENTIEVYREKGFTFDGKSELKLKIPGK